MRRSSRPDNKSTRPAANAGGALRRAAVLGISRGSLKFVRHRLRFRGGNRHAVTISSAVTAGGFVAFSVVNG